MATLTIADAARRCGVARRTIQRAIQHGRLTLTPDHRLTLEALREAGYAPATPLRPVTGAPQRRDAATAPQELSHLLTPLIDRLEQLIARLESLCQAIEHQPVTATPQGRAAATDAHGTAATDRSDTAAVTPHVTPQGLGTYDPQRAVARMQELRGQGYSLSQIAAQLTTEGIPTRWGKPWEHSTVRYMLKTYARGN